MACLWPVFSPGVYGQTRNSRLRFLEKNL